VQEEMCSDIIAALRQAGEAAPQEEDFPVEIVHSLNQQVEFDGISHYVHLEPEQDPVGAAKQFCKRENVSDSDCEQVTFVRVCFTHRCFRLCYSPCLLLFTVVKNALTKISRELVF
jgi:hypothetical protein